MTEFPDRPKPGDASSPSGLEPARAHLRAADPVLAVEPIQLRAAGLSQRKVIRDHEHEDDG